MPTKKKSFGAKPWVYPQPVFLVGTYDAEGKPNVMTAAWGGIVSSDPASLSVSVRPARWTYDAIMKRKAFTISIPDASKMKESDYVGMVSGRRFDKFSLSGFTPVKAEKVDAPYIDECPVVVECTLTQSIELGVHTMMIGAIEDVKVDEAILDATGNFADPEKFSPLAYASGSSTYHTLSEVLGKAFSVGKVFLRK